MNSKRERAAQFHLIDDDFEPSHPSAASSWILSVPPSYEPILYRPARTMRKYLTGKHILNESDCRLSGAEIEVLALDVGFVSDCTTAGETLDSRVSEYLQKVRNHLFFAGQSSRGTNAARPVHHSFKPIGRISHLLSKKYKSVLNVSPNNWNRHPAANVFASTPALSRPRDLMNDPICTKLLTDLKYALTKNKSRLRSRFGDGRLPKALSGAVLNLKRNPAFYVCKADKGGVTVLWSRDGYEREALRQLTDTCTYQEILPPSEGLVSESESEPVIPPVAADVLGRLLELKRDRIEWMFFLQVITERERNLMLCDDATASATVPHIYFSAKIHKAVRTDTNTWEGRPIVATFNGPLYWIDKFLAELTRPLHCKIPCSLVDTMELLHQIDNFVPVPVPIPKHPNQSNGGSSSSSSPPPHPLKLFSADARSLFTNIPWRDGADATMEIYSRQYAYLRSRASRLGSPVPPKPAEFRILLMTILENSYVQFRGGRVFHQIRGTAMGACISVFFARCYMYQRCTAPLLVNPPVHLHMLALFVDDVFFATTASTEDQIDRMMETIEAGSGSGSDASRLSFSRTALSSECDFLDVTVSVTSDGRLVAKPFSKPNCTPSFVHYRSAHPRSALAGVPRGEFLRLRRNSTYTADFVFAAKILKKRLSLRGYPQQVLDSAYQLALQEPRSRLLRGASAGSAPSHAASKRRLQRPLRREKQKKNPNGESCVRLIVPYSSGRDWKRARFILKRLDSRISVLRGAAASTTRSTTTSRMRSMLVFSSQKPIGASWTTCFKH